MPEKKIIQSTAAINALIESSLEVVDAFEKVSLLEQELLVRKELGPEFGKLWHELPAEQRCALWDQLPEEKRLDFARLKILVDQVRAHASGMAQDAVAFEKAETDSLNNEGRDLLLLALPVLYVWVNHGWFAAISALCVCLFLLLLSGRLRSLKWEVRRMEKRLQQHTVYSIQCDHDVKRDHSGIERSLGYIWSALLDIELVMRDQKGSIYAAAKKAGAIGDDIRE